MKACSDCKIAKPLAEFHANAHTKDGKCCICKECTKPRRRKWRAANMAKERAYHKARYEANPEYYQKKANKWYHNNKLKARCYRFGISPEVFESFVAKQNNQCAICAREAPLVIDHDHTTGNVRGLLCGTCNSGLGMFKESVAILRKAIKYIK